MLFESMSTTMPVGLFSIFAAVFWAMQNSQHIAIIFQQTFHLAFNDDDDDDDGDGNDECWKWQHQYTINIYSMDSLMFITAAVSSPISF